MWSPHVTVAVVVEDNGRYLMVEEFEHGKKVINQPAGHLEEGESILEAALRETLEETCWEIRLQAALGISKYIAPNGKTYLRHSFVGVAENEKLDFERDRDITDVLWLSNDEIQSSRYKLRSPMVMHDIRAYLKGKLYPLDFYSANIEDLR